MMTPGATNNHQAREREEENNREPQQRTAEERFLAHTVRCLRELDRLSMQGHDLKSDFVSSVNDYLTRQWHKNINPLLRLTTGDDFDDIKQEAKRKGLNGTDPQLFNGIINRIAKLDVGFKKMATSEQITVYRRVGSRVFGLPFVKESEDPLAKALANYDDWGRQWIGQEILNKYKILSERAYLSTSFSEKFTGDAFQSSLVHFEISVPAGTRAIAAIHPIFSAFHNEKELLLDRGYQMRIVHATKGIIEGKARLVVKTEIIPNNDHNKR